MSRNDKPLIVGLGGTTRTGSSSERVLRTCLLRLERRGAETLGFIGRDLLLPIYEFGGAELDPGAARLVEALRRADGVVICSPGYHGSMSGMVKNALDYLEELRDDQRPYLDQRAIGCIACASGWQAANSTLAALRSVAHSARGWPTPLGIACNSLAFQDGGTVLPPELDQQLEILAGQVLEHVSYRRRDEPASKAEEQAAALA